MDRNARGALEPIITAKRAEVDRLRPRAAQLLAAARLAPSTRPFEAALRGQNVRLIAEFKRRSPSAGWIHRDASVAQFVPEYQAAGAAALSILTDHEFFGGSLVDLEEARNLSTLPVLRKDFIIDEVQLLETRVANADAALLIVRILSQHELRDLVQAARDLGLGTLVETHNAEEVESALLAGAQVIGINNRDLSSFQTNTETAHGLLPQIPADVVVVAESGIRSSDDVRRYGAAGFDAVLVGEWLMRQADPGAAAQSLAVHPRSSRAVVATQ
ncbi:MAG: indole-3-glycerol phosphate synthase TrpC [Gemmatimonadota bacterium]